MKKSIISREIWHDAPFLQMDSIIVLKDKYVSFFER